MLSGKYAGMKRIFFKMPRGEGGKLEQMSEREKNDKIKRTVSE